MKNSIKEDIFNDLPIHKEKPVKKYHEEDSPAEACLAQSFHDKLHLNCPIRTAPINCQFIYKKLLHLSHPNIKDNNLTQFQTTLSETTHCDYVSDFTKMRERFANESQPSFANESHPSFTDITASNNCAQLHAQLKSALTARNRMEYEYGTFYANVWRAYDDIFRS